MGDTYIPISQEQMHRELINALEFMDNVIYNASLKHRKMFFDLIPRGVAPLGQGLVRKKHRFYGGLGDQAALTDWNAIQIGRDTDDAQGAYDACNYDAKLVDWAFQTDQYTGYETYRRTPDICINDIKWNWEFQQQLGLIFSFLGDITLSVWENLGRELYLKYCADANQIYLLVEGSPNGTPLSTTYNPFTSDEITIPRDVDLSTLDWSYMSWWHMFLTEQAPKGALAMDGDMPMFGLAVHPWDFDWMIHHNSELREDYRYANPGVLIENYGKVKGFKGYTLMNDMLPPRFQVKPGGVAASTLTLERVLPFTTSATTIGNKPVVNPDYINAQYAIGTIFLKDVFSLGVPPAGPASPGGGTRFGVVPSLMGEFTWLNYQTDDNPLGEKGKYFARFQAFDEPMPMSDYPVAFLYKRCPQTEVVGCTPCDTQAAVGTAVVISAATEIVGEGETANNVTQVEVTLASCLGCEAPAEVGIDYDGAGGADVTAVLDLDAEAPTYRITFDTAGDWVAAGTIVAGTSTLVCQ